MGLQVDKTDYAHKLSDNPGYKGFWESQGYINEGDFGKPFTS
jgi:hypothetical protein